jgi:hypothetical protein
MLISEIVGQTETMAGLLNIDLNLFWQFGSTYKKIINNSNDILKYNSQITNYPRSYIVPNLLFSINKFAGNVELYLHDLRSLHTRDIDPDLNRRIKKLVRMKEQVSNIKKKISKIKIG